MKTLRNPSLELEEAGNDDGRADGGEDEAEHEAPEPGKVEEQVRRHGHDERLDETGGEGQAKDQPCEKDARFHFEDREAVISGWNCKLHYRYASSGPAGPVRVRPS